MDTDNYHNVYFRLVILYLHLRVLSLGQNPKETRLIIVHNNQLFIIEWIDDKHSTEPKSL